MKLETVHPTMLYAIGDTERVEVLCSPVVREDDSWLKPVRRFIEDHGLVLVVHETFPDPDFMFDEVKVSVYVPPAVRNGILAGTELSLPWHAAAALAAAE